MAEIKELLRLASFLVELVAHQLHRPQYVSLLLIPELPVDLPIVRISHETISVEDLVEVVFRELADFF
jgi:hypothetical protein